MDMDWSKVSAIATVAGLIVAMVSALLGAIWFELRWIRKEIINVIKESVDARTAIQVLQARYATLPCQRGEPCDSNGCKVL